MARPKKKSLSQKAVSIGTIGMPKPVRRFLSGRKIATLIVVLTTVLFATGLVRVTWKSGLPKLSINQQRIGEVKEQVTRGIQGLSDKDGPIRSGVTNPLQSVPNQINPQFGSASDRKTSEGVMQKSAGLIQDFNNRLK